MCFNKKVLITLGVIAVAVFALQPSWIVAALPLLILAVCPLSMIFMMKGMNANQAKTPVEGSAAESDGLMLNKATQPTGKATFADRLDALWRQPKGYPSGDVNAVPGDRTGYSPPRDDRS